MNRNKVRSNASIKEEKSTFMSLNIQEKANLHKNIAITRRYRYYSVNKSKYYDL
jgi:hypothetical protein